METYGYIYITTNKFNGKRYIGQHKHKNWDSKYIGSGKYLKRAIKKYGLENFTCFPLAWAWNKNELNKLEIDYIAHYKPEYNLTKGGDGFTGNHREESKQKMKDSWRYEKHFSEKTKKKLSEKTKGENNPMYGKHHSKESIEKNRQSNLGHKQSDEIIRKKVESRKGYKHSEETKKKIGKKNKGHKHSEESKKKMSEFSRGIKWFNNGIKSIRAKDAPDGFNSGMLKRTA
jgi:group I intron endonuclease